jgi:hypothetical protein
LRHRLSDTCSSSSSTSRGDSSRRDSSKVRWTS